MVSSHCHSITITKDLPQTAMRLLVSLFALSSSRTDATCMCRSNATHLVWKDSYQPAPTWKTMPAFGSRRAQTLVRSSPSSCQSQLWDDATKECMAFLKDHRMEFDLPFSSTMGFPSDDEDGAADGLGYGMIRPTIELALEAKVQYPWTDDLPKDIFMDYVLNYANLNEARTNWRPLLVDALKFNESDLWKSGNANLTSVVTWVNTQLWTKLGRDNKPIYFASSQTPLIFDPMSTIAFGYASCTGTSILFSNALRAVGIPARVAGTPAWYGNATQGNHNWVEVYSEGHWKFLEPSPALPHVDTLDADPCSRWFCQPSRYPASKVYAAQLSRTTTFFPLAWEWDCQDVPAGDRTQYYADICSSCRQD